MKGVKINNPYPISDLSIKLEIIPKQVVLPVMGSDEIIVKVGDKVKVGDILATGTTYVHASISGVIEQITDEHIPHPSGLKTLCITIVSDGKDESLTYDKYPNYKDLSPQELLAKLDKSGIVGLGGAGFATNLKLKFLQNCYTIIINGTECEPAVEADNALMCESPREILLGAQILQYITGAKKVIIVIEDDKREAYENLLLFNSSDEITIKQVPTIYTSGAEKILIKNLLDIKIPAGEFATSYGILCQNVATTKAIYDFIVLGKPLLKRVVTISGDKETPHNTYARIGTPIGELVSDVGILRTGGLMMGVDIKNANYPILKTTNAVFNNSNKNNAITTDCIRCGRCADVCPEDLFPQQLYFFIKGENLDKSRQYEVDKCILCRSCDEVCPSNIPLSDYFAYGQAKNKSDDNDKSQAEKAKKRFEFREYRLERNKKERDEMMARKREEAKQKLAAKQKMEKENVD
jgi:electron transport complex protein RnfC